MVTIIGTAGRDIITGSSSNDTIYGRAGNDLIWSGGGVDTVYGEAGNDDLRSSGFGTYDGGDGNDHIWAGQGGTEVLRGGNGNGDLLVASAWTGNYSINLATQTTSVAGKTISGFESVIAGAGHNTITGSAADNTIMGGAGNDWIHGGAGIDTADYFWAAGSVVVNLQSGTTSGSDGSDTLISIENVMGSNYDDAIAGNGGSNYLRGAGGSDTMLGGAGADSIDGGGGVDTLSGGAGADVFNFAWANQSKEGTRHDLITDWVFDEDKIDLGRIDANEHVDGNQAFSTVKGMGVGQLNFSTLANGNTLIQGNTHSDATFELEFEVADGSRSHTYWSTSLDFVL
jgi:Ca2+-binding RTX toxin-like protein